MAISANSYHITGPMTIFFSVEQFPIKHVVDVGSFRWFFSTDLAPAVISI